MHQSIDVSINLDRLFVKRRPIKFPLSISVFLDFDAGYVQFQTSLHRFGQIAHQLFQNRPVRFFRKIQQIGRTRIRAIGLCEV